MSVCVLNNICKSYGAKVILSSFSLNINKGDLICIAGSSGSGKSTLLNIVGLLEKFDSGEFLLFDRVASSMSKKDILQMYRGKISFLFQNFALIDNETIDYNLNIALKVSTDKSDKRSKHEKKQEALQEVGLDLDLRTKIFRLSGGEQQRVALARVLLKESDLILADEPTASLDSENKKEIMELIIKLNKKGKTVLIVSHDEYIMEQCGVVIRL
jgi:putative ABC transport system ATP-binding protein